jgi:hypothetical protein
MRLDDFLRDGSGVKARRPLRRDPLKRRGEIVERDMVACLLRIAVCGQINAR